MTYLIGMLVQGRGKTGKERMSAVFKVKRFIVIVKQFVDRSFRLESVIFLPQNETNNSWNLEHRESG